MKIALEASARLLCNGNLLYALGFEAVLMQDTASREAMAAQANASDTTAVFSGTLNRLREQAQQYFGTTPIQIESLEYIEGPYSHVLHVRVHGPSGSWSAFVKCYKLHDNIATERSTVQQQVLSEFDVLQSTWTALANHPGSGVARPIACFPEELSLVTEQAPGVTIRSILNSSMLWRFSGKRRRFLLEMFERAGMWVKAFQTTGRHSGKISTVDIRGYVDVRLKILVQGGTLTLAQRSALLCQFDVHSAHVHDDDLAEVAIHSDFCPHNVLASDAAITAIDIPSSVTGSVYYDLAHMFIHLENLKARPWMGARLIEGVQAAMLRGFDRNLTPEHPLFQIELMRNMVSLLVQHQGTRESFPYRLYQSLIWRANWRLVRRWLDSGAVSGARAAN